MKYNQINEYFESYINKARPRSGWTLNECPLDIMTRQQGGGTHVCVQQVYLLEIGVQIKLVPINCNKWY